MTAGRKRTVSLEPDDMIKLGEEMVQWVQDNYDSVVHLSDWYTIEKMFTYNEWKTMHVCPEFFPYYEKAIKIVGRKFIDKNSNIRDGISQRWQRIYFSDLRDQEDSDADANAKRTANANRDAMIGTPANDKDLTIFHENLRMKDKINELERRLGESNGCEPKAST